MRDYHTSRLEFLDTDFCRNAHFSRLDCVFLYLSWFYAYMILKKIFLPVCCIEWYTEQLLFQDLLQNIHIQGAINIWKILLKSLVLNFVIIFQKILELIRVRIWGRSWNESCSVYYSIEHTEGNFFSTSFTRKTRADTKIRYQDAKSAHFCRNRCLKILALMYDNLMYHICPIKK